MSDTQGVLRGIIAKGCRTAGANQTYFREKVGGEALGRRASSEWYVAIQNQQGAINSRESIEKGLIRRLFGIIQIVPHEPIKLYVREWSAAVDAGSGKYRETWAGDADNFKDRSHMSELFLHSLRELSKKQTAPS